MALTKAFANLTTAAGSSFSVTCAAFDSTGYTHVVAAIRHDGQGTEAAGSPAAPRWSDNKSSGPWQLAHRWTGASRAAIIGFAKIGTPGTSHTVTFTHAAPNKAGNKMIVWLVNASNGQELTLDDLTYAEGVAQIESDAGSLSTNAATASFMFVAEGGAVTYTATSGWTEDADSGSYGASRTDASPTTIDPRATHDASASQDFSAWGMSFRESNVAVAFVGSNLAQSTSTITMPAHQANDLFIMMLSSGTEPTTLPSGWAWIQTSVGSTHKFRIAYKIAATGSETSGTWDTVDSLMVAVYRCTGGSFGVPVSVSNTGNSNAPTWASYTPSRSDRINWRLQYVNHLSASNLDAAYPSNVRYVIKHALPSGSHGLYDSLRGVGSYAGGSMTVNASNQWATAVIDLVVQQPQSFPARWATAA